MIPQALRAKGFGDPETVRMGGRKFRRLMIGTEGFSNTGKTEFMLSAPGPGAVISVDRGFDAIFDNPKPPTARREDFGFNVIQTPLASQSTDPRFYAEHWNKFYTAYKEALAIPEVRTIGIDCDSDTWELQRLAEWGTLQGIVSLRYAGVNASRRVLYARAWDSGKIVIAANKLSKDYKPVYNTDGSPKLDSAGKQVREWDGKSYERQGFNDQDYLFSLQIRHLYREGKGGPEWGLVILKCKADPSVQGMELWGDDCNFAGLVQTCYPHIPLEEWGF